MEKRALRTGAIGAFLILALLLTASVESQHRHPSDVTWHVDVESNSHQQSDTQGGNTTNTQDLEQHSDQWSDDGEQLTHEQTFHQHEDGSTEGEDDFGGEFHDFKGNSRTTWERDSEGNRKKHHEETIIDWDGNCEHFVTDDEYDRNGVNTKHTETTTPCDRFSLKIFMEGSVPTSSGTITYGPNEVTIPLWPWKESNYEGTYVGEFNATVTGECNATATYPVTFRVYAKGTDQLDFIVESSIGMAMVGSCEGGGGGSVSMPPVTGNTEFTLPAVDGASWTSPRSRNVKLTFTLKREKSADDWTR